jgi:hypothetical protein
VPAAQVQHQYIFSRSTKKMYFLERNRLYCLFKNFPLWYTGLLAPTLLINELLMLILALLSGWLLEKLHSYRDFIKTIPALIQQHRQHPITRAQLRPIMQRLTWRVPMPEGTPIPKFLFTLLNVYYYCLWQGLRLCATLVGAR